MTVSGVTVAGRKRSSCGGDLLRLLALSGTVFALSVFAGCTDESPAAEQSPRDALIPHFAESASAVGLGFVHNNGMQGDLLFNEVVGPGVALFDADGDGDLDVYLVQGHRLPDRGSNEPTELDRDRLLLNRLCKAAGECEAADFSYEDVTEQSGIESFGYGMGVAIGDANSDGLADIYVTNFGANQLWLNLDGARFASATEIGTMPPSLSGLGWSTSAAFFDLGNDGDDDLYVTNYVGYDPYNPQRCADQNTGSPDYCGPQGFEGEADVLFVNSDGVLVDQTLALGISERRGSGLGVVELDANLDGFSDLFVANDLMENYLWIWQEDRFVESAAESGVATNNMGEFEASMGIAVGDVDGDGREDLLSAHLEGETNTLYRNLGDGIFLDASQTSRLGAPSMSFTAFGTTFADFNVDGHLDAMVANGAVTLYNDKTRPAADRALGQSNLFFLGRGNGVFEEVTEQAGVSLMEGYVSRGLASGDLDNDGDVDMLVANNGGPLQVLINSYQQMRPTPWVGLDLVRANGAAALGATVRVRVGGRLVGPIFRIRRADSYLSSKDPRLLFPFFSGIEFEVTWTNRASVRVAGLAAGEYHRVVQRGDTGE